VFPIAFLIASALLMAAAQCFGWAAWLAFVAPIPLVTALARANFRQAWLRLGVFYAIVSVFALYWIRHTGPGIILFLPIIVIYSILYLAIPAGSLALAGGSPMRLWVLPGAWALAEILARRTLFELNWTLLGQPLADSPLLAQTASIAGPETVSFLVLALAVAAHLLLRGRKRETRISAGIIAGLLVSLMFAWGAVRLLPDSPRATINVAVVQPVNSQKLVWTPTNRQPVLDRMNALIDQAVRLNPAMIVLPESAIQGLVRYDDGLTRFVRDAVVRTELPLLFGSADYEDGKFTNVAILITPHNTVTTHRKIHLLPFIEYTPKGFRYGGPKEWPRYAPGVVRTVFTIRDVPPFAVGICLEDSLPELGREYVKAGARALIALVNTENFRGTSQPLQHLRRARLSAIAAGLPVVRAANSGISASIDSRGRVLAQLPQNVPAAALLPVAKPQATLYSAIGDWGAGLLFLAWIGAFTVLARYAKADETIVVRRGVKR
jgi:apolipoprotein N-acyltransferase